MTRLLNNPRLEAELCQAHRADAIRTVRNYFAQPEQVVFLNSEATPSRMHPETMELVVLTFNGELLFDSLVQPQQSLLWRTKRSPQITRQIMASAPPFPEIYPALCEAVRDKIVLAYNMAAEQQRFSAAMARYRLPPFPLQEWQCALRLYAAFIGAPTSSWSHPRKKLPLATHRARSDGETMLGHLRTISTTPLFIEAIPVKLSSPPLAPTPHVSYEQ